MLPGSWRFHDDERTLDGFTDRFRRRWCAFADADHSPKKHACTLRGPTTPSGAENRLLMTNQIFSSGENDGLWANSGDPDQPATHTVGSMPRQKAALRSSERSAAVCWKTRFKASKTAFFHLRIGKPLICDDHGPYFGVREAS